MPATERRWTRAEVLDLIERSPNRYPRYEVVDGVLLVTPAPRYLHQIAVVELLARLKAYFDVNPGVGEGCFSCDVEAEPDTRVEPDAFVVSLAEAKRVRNESPIHDLLLAVEVLSPSGRGFDRGRKRALYQRHVPEYWIVSLEDRRVERWRPGTTEPELLADRLAWTPSGATAPFVLDIRAYFARVFAEDP